MLVRRLAFALLVLLSLFASPLRAADLVESRSYWRDDSARADFASAQQQTYTPFERVFAGGYTAAVHWFRLRIAPTQAEVVFLRLRPHYLDSITVYDPVVAARGGPSPVQVGDLHPIKGGGAPSLSHAVRLPGHPVARDVWLRLETSSTHMLMPEAFEEVEGLRSESRWLGGFAVTLGVIALSVLWALVSLVGRPDPVLMWFALKQLVLAGNFALYTGLFRLLAGDGFAPETVSYMTSLFIILSVVMAGLFELVFLREFKPPPWVLRMGWVAWLPAVLNLLWFLLGHQQEALKFNSVCLLLITVSAFVLACTGRVWAQPNPEEELVLPRRWLVAYYLAMLGPPSLAIGSVLGLNNTGEWGLIGPLAYALVSGILMLGLLQVRVALLVRSQRERVERLKLAEARAQLEGKRREEQSRFLAMLAHELKTPLSVLRMSVGASKEGGLQMWPEASQAIDDMRAVIERCTQAAKVEEGAWVPQTQAVELGQAVRQAISRAPVGVIASRLASGRADTDPVILSAILANLVDNALKYRAVDSTISMELVADDVGWRLSVCNRPGVAGWPDPQQVFEKYYRSPGAHRETGSGLGLYLVARLAPLIGASVHYRPTPDEVRFELWMPRSISP